MISGLLFTASYIVFFKFISPEINTLDYWLFGISPEGIGVIGMLINFSFAIIISLFTKSPSENVIKLIDGIRSPR
jgi:cation/acetate symporter